MLYVCYFIYSSRQPCEVSTVIPCHTGGAEDSGYSGQTRNLNPKQCLLGSWICLQIEHNFQRACAPYTSLSLGSWVCLSLEIPPAVERDTPLDQLAPNGAGMLFRNQQSRNPHLRLNICLAMSSPREVNTQKRMRTMISGVLVRW